jgi:hypothetical protein
MSNCHSVAGGSLIDSVASRLALRAPALRAATVLLNDEREATVFLAEQMKPILGDDSIAPGQNQEHKLVRDEKQRNDESWNEVRGLQHTRH